MMRRRTETPSHLPQLMTVGLFSYWSNAWWLALLALLGMAALWKMERRAVVMVIVLTTVINIALTLAGNNR